MQISNVVPCAPSVPGKTPFRAMICLGWVLLAGAVVPAGAHGDLHERLTVLDEQIRQEPRNAELRFQRGELHRRHHEWDQALADFGSADRLQAGLDGTKLGRARVLLAMGRAPEAKAWADQFLSRQPQHAEGFITRAQVNAKLGRVVAAANDYSWAIQHLSQPMPDHFMEQARLLASVGRADLAVRGLDEGIARLGQIAPLQLAAIEYERQRGNFAAALGRVDRIVAVNPVKEPWLAMRGELLEQAGRLHEAREAFHATLEGIAQYQPVRRNRELTRQLEARARDGIARVDKKLLTLLKPSAGTLHSSLKQAP
jgi:tetratricopeptide (TPR) repeat protein